MPFSQLLRTAWRISLSHPSFYLWGGLMACAFLGSNLLIKTVPISLSDSPSPPMEELPLLALLSLFFLYVFFLLLHLFGKTGLILSLDTHRKKTDSSPSRKLSFIFLWKNFFRVLLLEMIAFAFVIGVTLILFIPLLVSSRYNPDIVSPLSIFSITALVPIYIVIFFVREYSLFYLLLSRLPLRQSFETGSSLFSRFTPRSLFFGSYALLVLVGFTFFLNLAMLNTVVLLEKTGFAAFAQPTSFAVGFILLAWFAVLYQALWYLFFIDLAAPKEPEPEKESVLMKENLPELPPA